MERIINFRKVSVLIGCLITLLITSCKEKIIVKTITDNDMELTSYYFNNFRNTSEIFVEMEIKNKSFLIARTVEYNIGDIYLTNDTLYIERFKSKSVYDTDIFFEGNVLGYVIKYKYYNRK